MIKFNQKVSRSEKKQIWMYAVILFTGAFIILLLTAYSQVKFQNNISEYQNKLSSEEKAKINVVSNLNTVLKENEKLKTDVEDLRKKIIETEESLAVQEEKNVELENQFTIEKKNLDLLFVAFEHYENNEYINCAVTLKYDINIQYLTPKAMQSYNELAGKVFAKASKMLYLEGYSSYKKGNFSEAIINLNRAIDISEKNEYYIDDAYYYLANSYYKTLNYEAAKQVINKFIREYSNSLFVDDMEKLLKSINAGSQN